MEDSPQLSTKEYMLQMSPSFSLEVLNKKQHLEQTIKLRSRPGATSRAQSHWDAFPDHCGPELASYRILDCYRIRVDLHHSPFHLPFPILCPISLLPLSDIVGFQIPFRPRFFNYSTVPNIETTVASSLSSVLTLLGNSAG